MVALRATTTCGIVRAVTPSDALATVNKRTPADARADASAPGAAAWLADPLATPTPRLTLAQRWALEPEWTGKATDL